MADAGTRAKYEAMLENMGINTLFSYPDGKGEEFEFELYFGEGSPPVNWSEAIDTFLIGISIHTKIPKEALKGNEIGLRSAETNRQAFLNTMTEEQTDSNADIMWMIEKEFGIEFDEGDDLRWRPLVEVDETEKVTVLAQKLATVQAALPFLDEMGMDLQDLYDALGLDMKIDEAKRQEAISQKEALREKIQEGLVEGQDEEDG